MNTTINFSIYSFLTATCSQVCQNGGTCIAPDVCSCRDGWAESDCSKGRSKNCHLNILLMPNYFDFSLNMVYRVQLYKLFMYFT